MRRIRRYYADYLDMGDAEGIIIDIWRISIMFEWRSRSR